MDRPRPSVTLTAASRRPRAKIDPEEYNNTPSESHRESQLDQIFTPEAQVTDNAFLGVPLKNLTTSLGSNPLIHPYHTSTHHPRNLLQNQPKPLFKAQ